jgi:heat shock protein HslJ
MPYLSHLPLWLALAAVPLALRAADEPNPAQAEIAPKVAAARAILDPWLARNPVPAQRKVHLILWTPKDREPAPRYRERLSAIFKDIQGYYAREMTRLGFGPRTIGLDLAEDGLVRVHLVKGLKDYAAYDVRSGGEIRKECVPVLEAAGLKADEETLVIFCNMSNWDAAARTISQNSPYYASGNHRSGTAWQVDSPILDLEFLPEQGQNVRDGQYGNISLGRYNSIFIGGAAHELGHALGLPHNRERPDERAAFGTALMGSGNRTYGEERRDESKGSFLTLAHGLRLASHPMFSGSWKDVGLRRSAQPADLAIRPQGKGFAFSGRVTGEPPVYGVIGYLDPEGGSDYDATTTTAIPDAEGRFTLDCQALAPGKAAELRVVYLQANGVASGFLSATPYRYPYTVAADGTADISAAVARLSPRPADEPAPPATPAAAAQADLATTLKTLTGSEWRLVEMGGAAVATNSLATLSFGEDGNVSGHGGVNRFNGRFTVEAKALKVGPLMSTRRAGPREAMQLEAGYMAALRGATGLEVEGETLRIPTRSGDKPLKFVRAKQPPASR